MEYYYAVMAKAKIMLEDTLYITMKVIDRSLQQDPSTYSEFESELDKIKVQLKDVLDKLEEKVIS